MRTSCLLGKQLIVRTTNMQDKHKIELRMNPEYLHVYLAEQECVLHYLGCIEQKIVQEQTVLLAYLL